MKTNGRFITSQTEQELISSSLPDCIYLNSNQSCSILRTSKCKGEECSFCRTYAESKTSNETAVKMLNALSADEQKKIASAYYGGKMPWKIREKSND